MMKGWGAQLSILLSSLKRSWELGDSRLRGHSGEKKAQAWSNHSMYRVGANEVVHFWGYYEGVRSAG